MVLETVQKKKFSQLNEKRYYFQCGIVSLLFHIPIYVKLMSSSGTKSKKWKLGF